MSHSAIADRIRGFLRKDLLYMRPDFVLDDNARLLQHRVIDSMGVMELIVFLEAEFGIGVKDEEVNEANLGTVAAITAFVAAKQAATRAA